MKTTITREEALRRWKASKEIKSKMVEKMKDMLYEDFKTRTGNEPTVFNVL